MAALMVASAATAWAQATASISGTVRDNTGAVLPGVTITATQTDTGLARTTVTNEAGAYSLPSLPLGTYRLEASLQGFSTYTQTNLVLQVGSSPVVDPSLSIGNVEERVEVTATASVVNTRNASIGTVVESQQIVELPLNARQVTQLVALSGLAVQTGASPGFSMNTGVNISVAGSSSFGVSYSLDGAPHLNNFDGAGLHFPFPDALQEFNLVTGAQEASSGVRAGASVNAVVKAGTNAFHGGLFGFLRDSRFNANQFFTNTKDGLKRNQFGGTVGGPLIRDKFFFFAGFQGTTTRQNPTNSIAFVPTAAMMAGDFTTFASPACNGGRQVTLRAPFVNNQINPALLSPAALNISRRLPTPVDGCGRVLFGTPLHQNESQTVARLDYQANQAHSLFGRYMLTTDDRQIPMTQEGATLLASSIPGSDDRAHAIAGGHTWVINSTMVNSLRAFGNDVLGQKPGGKFFGPQNIGMDAYTYVPEFMRIAVNGGFTIGQPFSQNVSTLIQNYGASEEFTLVRGAHELKFGGNYLWTKSDMVANAWSVGSYAFTGAITGNAMADFLVGRVGSHRQGTENPAQVTQPVANVFAQDTWRLNRVTLSYGVVWNPSFQANFFHDDVYTFNREAFLAGTTSTVMKNSPPGFSYPGDPGFAGRSGMKPQLNNWDPRVGFAWDVTGDGRTSLRAGASLGHEYLNHSAHANTSSVAPFRLTVTLPAGTSLDRPWADFPGGNPFPYVYNPANPVFPAYTAYLPLPDDLDATKQYSWNVALQRQITPRWFASATYVGTKVTNLVTLEEQNPGLNLGFGPCTLYDARVGANVNYPVCTVATNVDQRRLLNLARPGSALSYVSMYKATGSQRYNGMLLNTRFSLTDSLNVTANYTLSKCEGLQGTGTGGVVNVGNYPLHQPYQNAGPNDLNLDEGACAADRRHLFNATAVFQSGSHDGVLGALASNWTISTVIQARSGSPINVLTGSDIALNGFIDTTGGVTQRPNLVPGVDPYGADRSVLVGYLNPAAFSQPAPGTFGNTPWNYLTGPSFFQWDQAFTRGFTFGSGQRVEVRAEAINLLNTFNRGNPAASLNNLSTFGRITTLATGATERIWQFAVKYHF